MNNYQAIEKKKYQHMMKYYSIYYQIRELFFFNLFFIFHNNIILIY
ncbi:hypothetical protein pb186bvf_005120 [Paramecium bursaria]